MNLPPVNSKEPVVLRVHMTNSKASEELKYDVSLSGLRALRLQQYRATGLPDDETLLFTFDNQPVVDTNSNDQNGSFFPLLFDRFPDQMVTLDPPLPIMGNSILFNSSHRLKIVVKRQDGNPVIYSKLDLVFVGFNHFDQSENYLMYQ